MATARAMALTYEQNRSVCKYVHSASSGHEAIQLATAFQLQPQDFVSPYYRDESLLLGLGFSPEILMRQLLAKGNDIFTGGKVYYSHPNFSGDDKPTIIHQSSATGMQAIHNRYCTGISIQGKIGLIKTIPWYYVHWVMPALQKEKSVKPFRWLFLKNFQSYISSRTMTGVLVLHRKKPGTWMLFSMPAGLPDWKESK
jgi:hypothetical protein